MFEITNYRALWCFYLYLGLNIFNKLSSYYIHIILLQLKMKVKVWLKRKEKKKNGKSPEQKCPQKSNFLVSHLNTRVPQGKIIFIEQMKLEVNSLFTFITDSLNTLPKTIYQKYIEVSRLIIHFIKKPI